MSPVDKHAAANESATGNAQTADDILVQTGRITSHFALLERGLLELAHMLLGVPDNIAKTITGELSLHAVQTLVASLAKERIPEQSADLRRILKMIEKAEDKKNSVSRFLWGTLTADGGQKSTRVGPGLRLNEGELNANDLFNIATEISVAAHELEKFRMKVRQTIRK
jgi:hypothetical protein